MSSAIQCPQRMTNKLLPILLVFVFGIAGADTSFVDYTFTKEQKKIVQKVMTMEMEINEEIHQRFWENMPKEVLLEVLQNSDEFDALVDEIFLVAPKWQKAIWESVLLSYDNKKITKTSNYIKLLKKYNDNKIFKEGIINAERLMQAAATRTIMQTDRGTLNVTPEVANYALSNIEEGLQRAKTLFDPNYYE